MSNDRSRHGKARCFSQRAVAIGTGVVVIVTLSGAAWAQNGSLLQAAASMREPRTPAVAQTPTVAQAAAVAQAAGGFPPQATLAPPPGATATSPSAGGYPSTSTSGSEGIQLSGASWTYVPPPPVRSYQKHDIVTIRVDELSRMQAEGNAESRRNTLYDAVLKDWIALKGLDDVRPSPQSDGDPRVQGTLNRLDRADASLESRESLSFNIAAEIVDVRPNGDLVLEARKTIFVNNNAWETALSGICRATDIAPDNVVLSRDLLHLEIRKDDRGRLRDGYRRGWFTRWFDTFSPF